MSGIPTQKGDRALELFEQGLSQTVIAERLGVYRNHVTEMIKRAKARREKAGEGNNDPRPLRRHGKGNANGRS
jgi:transcriptional regulator